MAKAKSVKIQYGFGGNPQNFLIQRSITKWVGKGYRLEHRQDRDVGCFARLITLGLARGSTMLTFIKED